MCLAASKEFFYRPDSLLYTIEHKELESVPYEGCKKHISTTYNISAQTKIH